LTGTRIFMIPISRMGLNGKKVGGSYWPSRSQSMLLLRRTLTPPSLPAHGLSQCRLLSRGALDTHPNSRTPAGRNA